MDQLEEQSAQHLKDFKLAIEFKYLMKCAPGGVYLLPELDDIRRLHGVIFVRYDKQNFIHTEIMFILLLIGEESIVMVFSDLFWFSRRLTMTLIPTLKYTSLLRYIIHWWIHWYVYN